MGSEMCIRDRARIAQNGIGKFRTQAGVKEIRQIHQDGRTTTVGVASYKPVAEDVLIPDCPGQVTLDFVSPYRPSGKRSARPNEFDLSALLMAVVRRIDLLRYFYIGQKVDADFKALKIASLHSDLATCKLQRAERHHYAAREKRMRDISGLKGKIVFEGELLKPLWPFLYTGQYLNVGKLSSAGLGQYRLTPKWNM